MVGWVGPIARLDAVEKYISGRVVCSGPARWERAGETNNWNVMGCDFRIRGEPEAYVRQIKNWNSLFQAATPLVMNKMIFSH